MNTINTKGDFYECLLVKCAITDLLSALLKEGNRLKFLTRNPVYTGQIDKMISEFINTQLDESINRDFYLDMLKIDPKFSFGCDCKICKEKNKCG